MSLDRAPATREAAAQVKPAARPSHQDAESKTRDIQENRDKATTLDPARNTDHAEIDASRGDVWELRALQELLTKTAIEIDLIKAELAILSRSGEPDVSLDERQVADAVEQSPE